MSVETLSVRRIELDRDLQQREDGLDEGLVLDYLDHLDDLPPVTVVHDGRRWWLVDGFHRLEAHLRAGAAEIDCEVVEGTWLDAFRLSCGANGRHGLRRTTQDKRRAIRNALRIKAEKGFNWSNKEVSRICAVDDKTVAAVIRDLAREAEEMRNFRTPPRPAPPPSPLRGEGAPIVAPEPEPESAPDPRRAEEEGAELGEDLADAAEARRRKDPDPYAEVYERIAGWLHRLTRDLTAVGKYDAHRGTLEAIWADVGGREG